MPMCVVYGCSNRTCRKSEDKVTFHRFPKDKEGEKKWVLAVRRENWSPTKYSVVCSEHFSKSDFDNSSPFRVYLKKEAVPTILTAFPTHLKASTKSGGQKANNKGMKSKVITEGLKTGERKALRNGGEPRISPSGSQADGNSRSNEELKTSRIIKRSTLQVPASPPPAKRKVEEKELSATVKTLLPADFEDGQTYVPVSISEECDAMSTLWATKMRKLVEDQRVLAENLITQVLTKAYFGELTRRTLILDTVPSKSEPNLPRAYIGVE